MAQMKRANKPKSSAHSHVHEERHYLGEAAGEALIEWLNAASRKKCDSIEQLLRASADLAAGKNDFAAAKTIRAILRKSNLKLIPFWHVPLIERGERGEVGGRWSHGRKKLVPAMVLDRTRWVVEWDPVGRHMSRAQALAIYQALQLGSQGLLPRVRECQNQKCKLWFYARFIHQRFHSERCQLEAFRSDPQWKEKRAEYMRQLRWEEKQRKRRWIEASKSSKRKGRKR